MKFLPDVMQGPAITGYGAGWVAVNGQRFTDSIVISAMGHQASWDCAGFEALSDVHFNALATYEPELVIFGSGDRIRFPHPGWLQTLYGKRIGVETMDTQAACRTYNFLAGEGRRVVAALLL